MSFMNKLFANYDRVRVEITVRPNGSRRVQHFFDTPSKTDQSFKKDCDINSMIKRFTKANFGAGSRAKALFEKWMSQNTPGVDFQAPPVNGVYPDYQDALMIQQNADELFMALPSNLRKQFDNNPGMFLAFASNPANVAEMATMGLLKPEAVERLKEASTAVKTPSEGGSSTPPKVPS